MASTGVTSAPPSPFEGSRPDPDGSSQLPAGNHDTLRMFAMIGVIVCGGIQAISLAGGDELVLFAIIALLAWFFLAKHLLPIYLFFLGNMLVRLVLIANESLFVFRDSGPSDFLFHLFDNVTFVGLVAFAFIYFELIPQRLPQNLDVENDQTGNWKMFEPYSGLLFRLPLAVTMALLVYFLSQQIQTPIDPVILKTQFAQGYLLVCILFLVYLLVSTFFDFWSWRKITPQQARFYIQEQLGLEVRDELDAIQKPVWSRIDHPSAAGGMFFVQMLFSGLIAAIMMANAKVNGQEFLCGVTALFVFLTAMYNSYRTARNNVSSENHVIAMVAFVVLLFVGLQPIRFTDWLLKMAYLSWWSFNALVIIRMSYLWLIDEHFARKYNWETARPFSMVRFLVFLAEGLFGLFVLYFVSMVMVNLFLNPWVLE